MTSCGSSESTNYSHRLAHEHNLEVMNDITPPQMKLCDE